MTLTEKINDYRSKMPVNHAIIIAVVGTAATVAAALTAEKHIEEAIKK